MTRRRSALFLIAVDGQLRERPAGRRACRLTRSQAEIVKLLAQWRTDDEIASELGLSGARVAQQVKRIAQRLSVHSRGQIALWAIRQPDLAGSIAH